jgi:tetratricopeptide (TPR) repeat protein
MQPDNTKTELSKYHKLVRDINEHLNAYNQIEASRHRQMFPELTRIKQLLVCEAEELCNVSTVLKNSGHLIEGEAGLQQSLRIFTRFEASAEEALTRNNLAVLLGKTDRLIEALEHYQKALAIYERIQPGEMSSGLGNVTHGLAGILIRTQRCNEAIIYYRKALKIRQSLRQEPPFKLAKTLAELGQALLKNGELMEAETHLQRALSILNTLPYPDPDYMRIILITLGGVFTARAQASLSQVFPGVAGPIKRENPMPESHTENLASNTMMGLFQGNSPFKKKPEDSSTSGAKIKNLETAHAYFQNALAYQERAYGLESEELIDTLRMLRLTATESKHYSEAEVHGTRALNIAQQVEQPNSKLVTASLIGLANIFEETDRYQEAQTYYEQALHIIESQSASCREDLEIAILAGLALVFERTCRHKEAEAYYQRVLRLSEKKYGPQSIIVAEVLNNLTGILLSLDRYEDMQVYGERALSIYEEVLGPNSCETAQVLNNLGCLFDKIEHYEKAATYQHRALQIFQSMYGLHSKEVACSMSNLALRFRKMGQIEDATKYYQQALAIHDSLYGANGSSVMIGTLTNYADLLVMLGEHNTAKQLYQRALGISTRLNLYFTRGTTKALDGLGCLFMEMGARLEAISAYKESLAIKTQLYGPTSSERGETLCSLASAVDKNPIAIQYYTAAIENYEQSQLGDSYTACKIRLKLAQLLVRQGRQAANTQSPLRTQSYRAALELYNTLIKINHDLLQQLTHAFSAEDIAGHLFVLKELAVLYHLQGQSIKAGELFEKEAHLFCTQFPRFSLFCVDQALNHYALCAQTQSKRAQLLVFKAQLCQDFPIHLKPWRLAIECLQQAEYLAPSTESHRLLSEYQQAYELFSQSIDEDLLVQLERCIGNYDELENVFLFEEELSEYAQNKTTELMISLRNILDQAYSRLLTRMVGEPDHREWGDLYYPVRSSKMKMRDTWGKQKLLSDSFILLAKDLELENPNKTLYPDPPSAESVLQMLARAGCVELSAEKSYRIKNLDLERINWHANDVSIYPCLPLYTAQILNKLKIMYGGCRHTLDKDCPESYEAILQEQAFSYFDEMENEKRPGLWKESWLEKLTTINNDSKHVRLTPQEKKIDLQKQKGTLRQAQRKIQIQYLEKRFYAWSFIDILSHSQRFCGDKTRAYLQRLSDAGRLRLSREIRRSLRTSGHIVNHASAHTLALQYQKAKSEQQSFEALIPIRQAYLDTVRQSLALIADVYEIAVLNDITEMIGEFMLRRATRQGNIMYLEADIALEVRPFLRRTLQGVYHLVSTFSQQMAASYKAPKMTPLLSLPRSLSDNRELVDTTEFDRSEQACVLSKEIAALEHKGFALLSWDEIKHYHATLTQLSLWHTRQGNFKLSQHGYYVAAQKVAETFPLLAICYMENAILAYHHTNLIQDSCQLVIDLSVAYKNQGLTHKAISFLVSTIKTNPDPRLMQHVTLLESYPLSQPILVDADIHSQLEYARESLHSLRCEWFEYRALRSQSTTAQLSIQNHIFELIIKIRHLLDQAFRRLLKVTVLDPNGTELKLELLYNYPFNCRSEKQLQKRLKATLAIGNPPGCFNLDPTIFDILKSTQPFAFANIAEDWLSAIVNLSNKAKHEQQPKLLLPSQAIESGCPANKIEDILQVEGGLPIIPLLNKALLEITCIISAFFQIIRVYEKTHQPEDNSNDGFLLSYDLQSKTPISATHLIRQLNTIPGLSFFGVSDESYYVDAIMKINNEQDRAHATSLRDSLSGYGTFFRTERHQDVFVLSKINEGTGVTAFNNAFNIIKVC